MYRIGHAIDVHRLVENRKLILGGVQIPFEKGLLGHSDADVLLHAITEAIIGALALGDLGKHFPDTDDNYKNIDSKLLLYKILLIMEEKGYEVNNLDTTLILEQPKLQNYIPIIKESIVKLLNIPQDNVNIKAATNEKLGYLGAGEAIEAHATILLRKRI